MASFRIVQLTLGLIVALLFCMAVLTGIFLGCVAMISRESAAKMVEQLRQDMSDKLLYIRSLVIRDVPSRGKKALDEYGEGLKKEMHEEVDNSLRSIRNDHAAIAVFMENLQERLDGIEKNSADIVSLTKCMERHEEQVQGIISASEEFQEQINQFQQKVDDALSGAVQNDRMNQVLQELEERIATLEQTGNSLEKDLGRLKEQAMLIEEKVQSQRQEKRTAEHRLFAHIPNKAMQENIEELVTETLGSNMSYAQVIDHLMQNIAGKTANVLKAHPSLVKDYIRARRQNG